MSSLISASSRRGHHVGQVRDSTEVLRSSPSVERTDLWSRNWLLAAGLHATLYTHVQTHAPPHTCPHTRPHTRAHTLAPPHTCPHTHAHVDLFYNLRITCRLYFRLDLCRQLTKRYSISLVFVFTSMLSITILSIFTFV